MDTSPKDLEIIENKLDLEEAKIALAHVKEQGTISWNDLKKELNL